ncbi:hypothetical protein FRC12_001921 [Ceratobasidium sp. 428]|nr:hypothetical protein FRC12_001921 [Ceratobasidium sp. 428]
MFPNWHRPYRLLLEQAISEVALGIAGKFSNTTPSEATEWMQAARELRFPFWDWTNSRTNTKGLPDVLTAPKLELQMPGGGKQTHENILTYYEFHQPIDGFNNRLEYKTIYDAKAQPQKDPDTMAYFKEWNRTYRCPNSSPIECNDNIAQINETLTAKDLPNLPDSPIGSWANLSSLVKTFFNFPVDIPENLRANAWDEFSNTRFQSGHRNPENPKEIDSYYWNAAPLEQPHNYVHLVVGGIGHMGDNDTAGFDPIFYLHHCNVDRLLSFWEQVYPDYVAGKQGFLDKDGKTRVPFTQKYGTYIETVQSEVDDETPLMPFRKSDYTYWNSADTHSLQHTPKDDDSFVRKHYTYPAINGVELNLGPPLSIEEREEQRILLREYFTVFRPSKYVDKDYVVTVSLDESYFTGSYMLKLFLQIGQDQFEVGAVAVLGRGNSAGCGNCQGKREAGARVRGIIPIPAAAVHELVKLNVPITTTEQATEPPADPASALLLNNFRPHLVLPSGKLLSWPSGNVPASFAQTRSLARQAESPLPARAVPGLKLVSRERKVGGIGEPGHIPHRGGQVPSKEHLPVQLDDWSDHGSPDLGSWVKAA